MRGGAVGKKRRQTRPLAKLRRNPGEFRAWRDGPEFPSDFPAFLSTADPGEIAGILQRATAQAGIAHFRQLQEQIEEPPQISCAGVHALTLRRPDFNPLAWFVTRAGKQCELPLRAGGGADARP